MRLEMHSEGKIEPHWRYTSRPRTSEIGDVLGGHDCLRLEEYSEMVNLEVVDLGAVNLKLVNLEVINMEPVNLKLVNLELVNVKLVNLDAFNREAVNLKTVNWEAMSSKRC